ncbi:phosphate/phosphite/phosphonate ABC transporter substrate-binding protein [Fimbriiglobus ruber]|uniref:Phosphonate ABC transporter phosphate-binding periplasmic component n=1 Tax=Fimbriiglobus ruber TaxID=1908690 RepID=A0A225DHC9_9BACT|nr:PhnD/SsuA/transferrin family substrate-binding protein [Fimbriiglobus ruber]OWK39074.1 Phosphonate ABC transporter phosphate-binding periplasmic component [Fimbriiglobus ruber]
MERPVRIGAVAYDPRVVPIWEGMRDYFREAGPPIDYVLFSNYDSQVQALLDRHIDIAWNTNLAWVKVYRRTDGTCRALAMRDVDANFTTVFVTRTDSGVGALADVRGKRLALGSADSAQAAILPVHFLHQSGVEPDRDCTLLRFDLDVGKHGDTGTSELEVLKALRDNRADVGAIGDATWAKQLAEGRIDPSQVRAFWTSPGYCHCNFTVLGDFPEDIGRNWTDSLMGMRYDDPRWRELMDLEGLKRWLPTDAEVMKGYDVLFEAARQQGLYGRWM